jgi:hypothetical protein
MLLWTTWIHSSTSQPILRYVSQLLPLPPLNLSNYLFNSRLLTEMLNEFIVCPMHATCSANLILTDFTSLTKFVKSIHYGAPHDMLSPVSSYFIPFRPNITICTLFSINGLNLMQETNFHTHIKQHIGFLFCTFQYLRFEILDGNTKTLSWVVSSIPLIKFALNFDVRIIFIGPIFKLKFR